MYFKWKIKFGALILALSMILTSSIVVPVFADNTSAQNIEVIFTDVTESDLSTLTGEAKIKVSVKGAAGNASIAQIALDFSGNMDYKSIQFLKGKNNPPECFLYSPNTALANAKNRLIPSIISSNSLSFDDVTDLFILTFAGQTGESVTLSLSDLENTYCTIAGSDLKPAAGTQIVASASSKANEGKKATIKLVMDKVTDFTAGADSDYSNSGVEVKITSEQTSGYTVYTVLNNTLISKGGHRENETIPTFTVENTVLKDDTYTVEISGIGYVPYKATGVTFNSVLNLTNADFIPGDINADQKVDDIDKAECEKAIADSSYAIELGGAADFNRDGVTDKYDLTVFGTQGGDSDNTGENTGDTSGNTGSGSAGGAAGGAAGGGAAGGAAGGGEAKDETEKNTDTENTNDNKETEPTLSIKKEFSDLGNHTWAQDSIYTLQAKGIISGISDTEYAPANNIKRGDFILILTRMLDTKAEAGDNFTDVPVGSYYYDAIAKAKAAGIATGDGISFMPENSITRQDLITLSYRAFLTLGHIEEVTDYSVLDQFNDKDTISDYALAPLASMVKAGIIKGSDNGGVNPNGFATRAEVAVMCARLLELIK